MSDERKASMKAYGAEIILTPAAGSMEAAIDLARKWSSGMGDSGPVCQSDIHSLIMRVRAWNLAGHQGKVTHFVSAMGLPHDYGTSNFSRSKIDDSDYRVQPEGDSKIPASDAGPRNFTQNLWGRSRWQNYRCRSTNSWKRHRALASEEVFLQVFHRCAVAAALRVSEKLKMRWLW